MPKQRQVKERKVAINEVRVKIESDESADVLPKNKGAKSKRLAKQNQKIEDVGKDVVEKDAVTDVSDESSSHSDMKRLARIREEIWKKRSQLQRKQAINVDDGTTYISESKRSKVNLSGSDSTSSTSEYPKRIQTTEKVREI